MGGPFGDGEREWVEYFAGEEPAPASADAMAAREVTDQMLNLLAPDDRLVLTLLDLEERSVAEISGLKAWGRSAVKVRAFAGKQEFPIEVSGVKNDENSGTLSLRLFGEYDAQLLLMREE